MFREGLLGTRLNYHLHVNLLMSIFAHPPKQVCSVRAGPLGLGYSLAKSKCSIVLIELISQICISCTNQFNHLQTQLPKYLLNTSAYVYLSYVKLKTSQTKTHCSFPRVVSPAFLRWVSVSYDNQAQIHQPLTYLLILPPHHPF